MCSKTHHFLFASISDCFVRVTYGLLQISDCSIRIAVNLTFNRMFDCSIRGYQSVFCDPKFAYLQNVIFAIIVA